MSSSYRLLYVLIYVAICLAAGWVVNRLSYQAALTQLATTGRVRVEQAQDRLLGQLEAHKQLPNMLARHPDILALVDGSGDLAKTQELLLNTALAFGVESIAVLDRTGNRIAASHPAQPIVASALGQPHIQAALQGRLGVFHAIDPRDGSRDFYFARGIFDTIGPPIALVNVQIDISALEFDWRIDEEVITFFDEDQIVFVTNRPDLALLNKSEGPRQTFPGFTASRVADQEIWTFDEPRDLPQRALVLTRDIPQIDMTARVFLDTSPARAAARLRAQLVIALLALLGFGLWALGQRRQRLADLLAVEEAANQQLEARVEKRTEQLRRTQHQLIQAGKLTALGQMSAGISHELNQPLAAMLNFAQNGRKLLSLDRTSEAAENFNNIQTQIDRMSRIIRSLRAFARKEKETIEPVDLHAVISDSLALSQARLEKEGVNLQLTGDTTPIQVMGGHVRLQQVVINLLTNALDAVADQPRKQITVDVQIKEKTAQITIHDNGPGLADPTRVFEPFYSTKEQGTSKGMGLGLSISYGIIGSFGGDMTCTNHPDGGAVFTLTLQLAEDRR